MLYAIGKLRKKKGGLLLELLLGKALGIRCSFGSNPFRIGRLESRLLPNNRTLPIYPFMRVDDFILCTLVTKVNMLGLILAKSKSFFTTL